MDYLYLTVSRQVKMNIIHRRACTRPSAGVRTVVGASEKPHLYKTGSRSSSSSRRCRGDGRPGIMRLGDRLGDDRGPGCVADPPGYFRRRRRRRIYNGAKISFFDTAEKIRGRRRRNSARSRTDDRSGNVQRRNSKIDQTESYKWHWECCFTPPPRHTHPVRTNSQKILP